MNPTLAGLAAQQHGMFTTAQALAAGYDQREVARLLRIGRWVRLRRGIYLMADQFPADLAQRHVMMARAVLFRVVPPACASHATAAAVHDLVLLEPDWSVISITRPALASSRVEAGVHHHVGLIPPQHLAMVDGLPVSDVAWTLVDLAREVTFEQGVVAAEAAIWAGRTTKADLQTVLFGCRDWPGARNAGHVVSFASGGSESPGESISRIAFERHGLPAPQQQVEMYDQAGLIGRVDFYWPEHATIGEFDGRVKYEGEAAKIDTLYAEKHREDRLRDLGLQVVRFGWADARFQSADLARRVRIAFARSAQQDVRAAR
jgi:hypothetical protein